jgi:hypothetical protein
LSIILSYFIRRSNFFFGCFFSPKFQSCDFEADEDIYHHTKNLIEQLAERFIKEGEIYPNGSVVHEQFNQILKKYLPNKSSNDINELTIAAEKEQGNEEKISLGKLFSVVSYIVYHKFFISNAFFARMMKIIMENLFVFLNDNWMKISKVIFMMYKKKLEVLSINKNYIARWFCISLFSSVNAKDMEQAIRSVHPHIKQNELAHIVQWTFEAKDGSQIPSMNIAEVLQRLQNCVFYRQHTLSPWR